MSEPFKVPEPSWEATGKARVPIQAEVNSHRPLTQKPWYIYDANIEAGLRAAYAVDVPRIVRAEVERAWHWWHESDAEGVMPLEASFVDYLAARFGEPENAKTVCGMGDDNCRDGVTACTRGKGHPGNHYSVHADRSWPSPSAPAAPSVTAAPPERREPEGLKLGPSAVEIPVTFRKTDSGEVVGYAITPAERDFLRNLAKRYAYQEHECPIRPSELWASARKVVEESRGK